MTTKLTLHQKKDVLKQHYLATFGRMINPLKYFKAQNYQLPFFDSELLNVLVLGGNRSGKTLSSAVYVIEHALNNPNSDIWCSTWYELSVPVQQKTIYNMLPKNEIHYGKFNDLRGFSNRLVVLKNGSMIKFKTYDQGWETYQGTNKDLIWLDEEAPQTIVNECKARLIDRNGKMVRSMTPLNGMTYTYDEFFIKPNEETTHFFFDSSMNKHINQKAFSRIIGEFSSKEAEVRKEGVFLNLTSGLAYYSFGDDNIIDKFEYDGRRPVDIHCDFNIDLMSWNISQEISGVDYIFDFIEQEGNANTEKLCMELKDKLIGMKQRGVISFFVDLAGSQRRPETSMTNIAIIQKQFPHAKIYYQAVKNIKDRVESLNARLCNSKGIRKLFVMRKCDRLIHDFRRVTWEMLLENKKQGMFTHSSDGTTYFTFWRYPSIPITKTIATNG